MTCRISNKLPTTLRIACGGGELVYLVHLLLMHLINGTIKVEVMEAESNSLFMIIY